MSFSRREEEEYCTAHAGLNTLPPMTAFFLEQDQVTSFWRLNRKFAIVFFFVYRQLVTGSQAPNIEVWHSNLAVKWQLYHEEWDETPELHIK